MNKHFTIFVIVLLTIVISCETQLMSRPIPGTMQFDNKLTISETTDEIIINIHTNLKPELYKIYRFSVLLDDGTDLALYMDKIMKIQYKDGYFIFHIKKIHLANKEIIEAGALLVIKKTGKTEVYSYSKKSDINR